MAALSVAEFHKLYDGAKPAYEYWYGEAAQKSLPTTLHGLTQSVICIMLDSCGWNVALEVRLKIVPEAEPVPDAIAVRGKFKGRYQTAAPELCVEIMSPDDTLAKVFRKGGQYITWERNAFGSSTRKSEPHGRYPKHILTRSGFIPPALYELVKRLSNYLTFLPTSTQNWS